MIPGGAHVQPGPSICSRTILPRWRKYDPVLEAQSLDLRRGRIEAGDVDERMRAPLERA
jgi:hypothetical protein